MSETPRDDLISLIVGEHPDLRDAAEDALAIIGAWLYQNADTVAKPRRVAASILGMKFTASTGTNPKDVRNVAAFLLGDVATLKERLRG